MERIQVVVSRGQLPEWLGAIFTGYGSGYGDGSGYGYGDGYGDGSGDGSGDGYGSGYGSGSGDGSGYGDGYGDGSGDGSGYGSGYGYGEKEAPNYKTLFEQQQKGWPEAVQSRIKAVLSDCSALAFWRSDKKGLPSNSGDRSITPAAIGVVHEVKGNLRICSNGLHATVAPEKWEGERVWVVALFGEIQWKDDKCAAMKREILAEIQL